MKLIVTIPAYNEEATIAEVVKSIPRRIKGIKKVEILVWSDGSTDKTVEKAKKARAHHVFASKKNLGLAKTFALATQKAVTLGANIVVNTDADNQYDQKQIASLIAPILQGQADVVNGNRQVELLSHMPPSKKFGNIIGSFTLRLLSNLPLQDASSGFRAYTAEAIGYLNITSNHTYTHESLIQLGHSHLKVVEIPVTFKKRHQDSGQSRLISGVFSHIFKSGATIIRTIMLYHSFTVINSVAALFLVFAAVGFVRFFYFFAQGNDEKIYSLLFAIFLTLSAVNLFTMSFIADMISRNIIRRKSNVL